MLTSHATGKNLRIKKDLTIDARGGHGGLVRFVVDPSKDGHLRLFSKATGKYLAIRHGELTTGGGGKFTRLQVVPKGRHICLRGVEEDGGVGIRDDGSPKDPTSTGHGKHAQFTVNFV